MKGVRLVRQQGRRAIAVDDVVQSIEVVDDRETPGYWPEMLPGRPVSSALVLGHGGGTIVRLLLLGDGARRVLAVDDNSEVLGLAAGHAYFKVEDPRLTIELADAFEVARRLAEAGERFDYVALDLYRGAEMVRAMLARPFLRRVEALLTDDGIAAFNLPRDRRTARRLRRLGQHLKLVETRLVGLNCVALCERLDAPEAKRP